MTKLFVIEAPGKLKKLRKILGREWTVLATSGHIRELAKTGPNKLGFELNHKQKEVRLKFTPRNDRAKETINKLHAAAQKATEIYIATDLDREGEIIAWHVAQVIGQSKPIYRVAYSEISARAINQAIANPRKIDTNLVAAGFGRSVLDKLIGFTGSPLLWDYVPGAKSLGRVQTPATALICEREEEIKNFKPETYYSIWSEYKEGFKAFFSGEAQSGNGDEVEQETDDSKDLSETNEVESHRVTSREDAERIVAIARDNNHCVVSLTKKQSKKNPPAPFTTSNLQQAAGSRLKLSPDQTMKIAQKLYEAGIITYHRTDSTTLSAEFIQALRSFLQTNDPDNLPESAVTHRQTKGAQEAHEAIRPVDVNNRGEDLQGTEAKLYQLIWQRTVASQCRPAALDKTKITTQAGTTFWEAKGQVVVLEGYLRYWRDLGGDSELPTVAEGQSVTLEKSQADEKQTKPPSRYTEAQMVKLMERKGIGRPSTFSPTIATIKERGYVTVERRMLVPTDLGMRFYHFIKEYMGDLGEVTLTADMECRLDAIARGKEKWQPYVCDFDCNHWEPILETVRNKLGKPKQEQKKTQTKETKTPCPKCEKLLHAKKYTRKKDGKESVMLTCLKCRDIAFFQSYQNATKFWSKGYGEISLKC